MKRLVLGFAMLIPLVGLHAQLPTYNKDSLLHLIRTSEGEAKMQHLQNIIIQNWLNLPDTAFRYAYQASRYAEEQDNDRFRSIAIRLRGGVHLYKGNYDSSLYCNKKALEYTIQLGDSVLMSSCLNNIGFAHYHFANYPLALESLLNSLNMKRIHKISYGMGHTLNNLGLVYSQLKNFDEARKYFAEALELSQQTKDRSIELYTLNNIGFTYLDQDNILEARRYYEKSLQVAEGLNNANWHAAAYSGMGRVLWKEGNIREAKKLFHRAYKLRNSIGDKRGIAESYYYFAEIKAAEKQYDSAYYYVRQSAKMARLAKVRDRKLLALGLATRLYEERRNYDSALYYQTRYLILSDSLFNENLARDLAEIQIRMRDAETEKVLRQKDFELSRKTLVANFLIIIFIVSLLFLAAFFYSYRMQRKLATKLRKSNDELLKGRGEIEKQKSALEASNKELEDARVWIQTQNQKLGQLNTELKEIVDQRTFQLDEATRELKLVSLELDHLIYKSSHDIKGPLVRLLSICHVADLEVQDERAVKYIKMMSDTARQLNDIFDRLSTISSINTGALTLQVVDFDLLAGKCLKNLSKSENYKEIEISTQVEQQVLFQSDIFLVETILTNMLDNAVRFLNESAIEKKAISVKVKTDSRGAVISIIDNGIGIKESDAKHIFELFSKAAQEHHHIGLGLYVVKQCVNKLEGTIQLKPNKEGMTEFEIFLPQMQLPT
jgi:signal transduction histidine kinase/Flp pilus assembly protein TadD